MRANRRALARLGRDTRGNTYVVEAMVVAMFAFTAIAVVNHQTATPQPWPKEGLAATDADLTSTLNALQHRPSDRTDIQFDSRLEELMLEDRADVGHDLRKFFLELWPGSDHVSWLTMPDGSRERLMGYTYPDPQPMTTDERAYIPGWGSTLVYPGMSHYTPDQAVDLHMLAVEAARVGYGNDYPYTVSIQGMDADDVPVRAESWFVARTPSETLHDQNPPVLRFTDSADTPIILADSLTLQTNLTHITWPLRIKITPTNESHPDSFFMHGDRYVLTVPPGWNVEDDQAEDVTLFDDSLPYVLGRATTRDSASEYWWNINLTRSVASPVTGMQSVSVMAQATPGAVATLPLLPSTSTHDTVRIHVDHPDPIPSETVGVVRIVLTNPKNTDVTIDSLVVANRDNVPVERIQSPDSSWKTGEDGLRHATFTYSHEITIPAGKAEVIELPLQMNQTANKGPMTPLRMPLVVSGYEDVLASEASGPLGGQTAWVLPGMGPAAGEAAVSVLPRDEADKTRYPWSYPPGAGSYTVTTEAAAAAFLDEIQEARHTASLDVEPFVFRAADDVAAVLDIEHVLEVLRQSDVVDLDTVSLSVRAYDNLGILFDKPYVNVTVPLNTDLAPSIKAMENVDLNHDGIEDVLVAYADGRLVALDGRGLPSVLLWRADLGHEWTSGPVLVDLDEDGVEEIVMGAHSKPESYLVVLDNDGKELKRISRDGRARDALSRSCMGEPGVAWIEDGSDEQVEYERRATNGTATTESYKGLFPRVATMNGAYGIHTGEPYVKGFSVGLHEAFVGPFGSCDLISTYTDGHVLRSNGTTLAIVNDFDVGETILTSYAGNFSDTRMEQIQRERGGASVFDEFALLYHRADGKQYLEVFDGWMPRLQPWPQMPTGVSLVPGDEFVGLTWVDADVGYLGSKMGYFWKTNDGGGLWVKMNVKPVVSPGRFLEDFVMGAGDVGILLNSDASFAHYTLGGEPVWDELARGSKDNITDLDLYQGEPSIVVTSFDQERVKVRGFNASTARIDKALATIDCACNDAVLVNDASLLQSAGNWTHIAGEGTRTGTLDGLGAIGVDARLLEADTGRVRIQDDSGSTELVHADSRLPSPDSPGIRDGPVGPGTLATPGHLLQVATNQPVLFAFGGIDTPRPSDGYARASWIVNDTLLDTSTKGALRGFLFDSNAVSSDAEAVLEHPFADTAWRQIDSDGTITEGTGPIPIDATQSRQLIAFVDPGAPETNEWVLVTSEGDFSFPLKDTTCRACVQALDSLTDPNRPDVGPVVTHPRSRVTSTLVDPLLLQTPQNMRFIVHESDASLGALDAASTIRVGGATWAGVAGETVTVLRAAGADDDGVFYVERGVGSPETPTPPPGPPINGPGGEIGGVPEPPTGVSSHQWTAYDASTLSRLCILTADVTGQQNHASTMAGNDVVLGSQAGLLSVVNLDACKKSATGSPVRVGNGIVLDLADARPSFRGPHVVKATVSFDLRDVGTMELHWTDYGVQDETNRIPRRVLYDLHTIVIDPSSRIGRY